MNIISSVKEIKKKSLVKERIRLERMVKKGLDDIECLEGNKKENKRKERVKGKRRR